jgi:hypothetical protein
VVWRLEKINRGADVADDARVNIALNVSSKQRTKSWYI